MTARHPRVAQGVLRMESAGRLVPPRRTHRRVASVRLVPQDVGDRRLASRRALLVAPVRRGATGPGETAPWTTRADCRRRCFRRAGRRAGSAPACWAIRPPPAVRRVPGLWNRLAPCGPPAAGRHPSRARKTLLRARYRGPLTSTTGRGDDECPSRARRRRHASPCRAGACAPGASLDHGRADCPEEHMKPPPDALTQNCHRGGTVDRGCVCL